MDSEEESESFYSLSPDPDVPTESEYYTEEIEDSDEFKEYNPKLENTKESEYYTEEIEDSDEFKEYNPKLENTKESEYYTEEIEDSDEFKEYNPKLENTKESEYYTEEIEDSDKFKEYNPKLENTKESEYYTEEIEDSDEFKEYNPKLENTKESEYYTEEIEDSDKFKEYNPKLENTKDAATETEESEFEDSSYVFETKLLETIVEEPELEEAEATDYESEQFFVLSNQPEPRTDASAAAVIADDYIPLNTVRPPILVETREDPIIEPEPWRVARELVSRESVYLASSVLADKGNPRTPLWHMLGRPRPPHRSPRRRRLPPLEVMLPPRPGAHPDEQFSTVYGPTFRATAPHIVYEDNPLPNTSMLLHNEMAGCVECDCSVMNVIIDQVSLPVIMVNPACEDMEHQPYNREYADNAESPNVSFTMLAGRMICIPGNEDEEEFLQDVAAMYVGYEGGDYIDDSTMPPPRRHPSPPLMVSTPHMVPLPYDQHVPTQPMIPFHPAAGSQCHHGGDFHHPPSGAYDQQLARTAAGSQCHHGGDFHHPPSGAYDQQLARTAAGSQCHHGGDFHHPPSGAYDQQLARTAAGSQCHHGGDFHHPPSGVYDQQLARTAAGSQCHHGGDFHHPPSGAYDQQLARTAAGSQCHPGGDFHHPPSGAYDQQLAHTGYQYSESQAQQVPWAPVNLPALTMPNGSRVYMHTDPSGEVHFLPEWEHQQQMGHPGGPSFGPVTTIMGPYPPNYWQPQFQPQYPERYEYEVNPREEAPVAGASGFTPRPAQEVLPPETPGESAKPDLADQGEKDPATSSVDPHSEVKDDESNETNKSSQDANPEV